MKKTITIFYLLLLAAINSYADGCPRIISQSPYITRSLQWLDLEACIVGVSRYDTLALPHTGGVLDPDADAIAALEPQLLFTSDWTPAEKLAAVTPKGTRSFRLDGFRSMAQIEENLLTIGEAAHITDIDARVAQFHRQWVEAAHAIDGNGQRALLLSSCSGMPYSFGKERWLADLFTEAGFTIVESEPVLRHIRPGEEVATINALIDQLQPQLLFIFERKLQPQCAFIKPKTPIRIITLDGEKFLHPAPVILEGLEELASKRKEWSSR